jgi:uncharacterized protein (DUF58 family)
MNSPPLFDENFLRKLERLAILSRRAMSGQLQGERRSTKRGQSVEFADFRPYSSGDDFRRIDWNAYARLERLFIKLFIEEEDLSVHLLIDTSKSMDWGNPNKMWYARRAAGALGYIALAGLDRVTITALSSSNGNSPYFPPHRGKAMAFKMFSFLQELPVGGHIDLASRLRAYSSKATQPGPLILFSDLMDDGWADGLRSLVSRKYEISVIHILSTDEVDPGLFGDLKLIDSETSLAVEITADFDLLARYKAGFSVWQEEIRRFCGTRGIHYVPVVSSLPFDELLFAWLRRYMVLK